MGLMRFCTAEWWAKCQDLNSDFNPQQALDQYKEYFARVSSELPSAILKLQSICTLHDSSLRFLNLQVADRCLTLNIDFAKFGKYEQEKSLVLKYEGVQSFKSTVDTERGRLGPDGYGDLGYDEFHLLAPRQFEHAFLFSSGIEIAVEFGSFAYDILN